MVKSFQCPHNKTVHIAGKCVINECPYHMSRVNELFNIEVKSTACAYYDSDLMQNVSTARTQISALSRDPRRRISPKLIRSTFENAKNTSKTLYMLTHEVVNNNFCCENCGYPIKRGIKCTAVDLCNSRKNWVQSVCSQYQIDTSISKYQVVWRLLLQNELFLPQNSLRIGYSLCNQHDVKGNPNIPEEYLEFSP